MKRLAIFCGSRNGASEDYIQQAKELGSKLAEQNVALVYGGASVGIMGAVADAVLHGGGHVIGVMPQFLKEKEISHPSLTELIIVDSMHERKMKMAELADGFIALPGGPGTLEEFFEVFTWAQLGLHQKPCGLLNINHYFDPLISLFQHMTDEHFMEKKHRDMVIIDKNASTLLRNFIAYVAPPTKTYITKSQT
ncbi:MULTISPECIES: LOG family protein [Virgibacillus]|uniref:Cytokinin riboside 5'-monophosphate phosphoribohydrolase n=2 Tax=Virgibacillus TaxID=84406 RepID=A0A024QI86_9BACI|nr:MULTISPECIES: TIGR00730 family Rossman fold protein [Virgibacillus]EQB37028.1 hypothetical protein M948_11420 [Virgibacillus sp. CM-4]MYL43200.1 TIGR00730 family Rossman fold protein [Virgibacillus massiliensis]GGJ64070.1 cytokinin riboside 5'-monophosphate phosphoribohydrolase [Virgibacillus kapii]CDQ41666.1 LOG family protein YvdD [Virgibacillus massiliensis]